MAWPATKTILAMKDTSAPDLTIKVTGYQWKWGYDYLQEGFGFYSNLSTPLAQIENREPKGPNYLLEVDHPLVVPVGHEGARHHHRQRRAPRLVGAGARRQAGRDSRASCATRWFQRGEGRHLPRPMRRAVRQGARLHADRGRGEVEGRLREVGRRAEAEMAAAARRSEQDVDRGRADGQGRDGLRGELRGLPPGERQGRAGRVPGARGQPDRDRPAAGADPARAERQAGHRDAAVEAAVRRRHRRRSSRTRATAGATRRRRDAGRPSRPRASNAQSARVKRQEQKRHEHHPARSRSQATTTPTPITATTITRITPRGSCAGSPRPITRTSARCTCCSR